jgi:hypothetical protein
VDLDTIHRMRIVIASTCAHNRRAIENRWIRV